MFSSTNYANCANTNMYMYSRTRNRGLWGQVWSVLTGRSHCLFTLAGIEAACTVGARRYAGMQTVPINQIQGSQDRGCDFDRDFNPLQDHNKERWLGIARARRRGTTLPPVDLVQVGDVYFVWDGHHRISVARALGQLDIEAKVTVWQVSGSLPWEKMATGHSHAGQEMGIKRLYGKVKDDGARLQERFSLGLSNLLTAAWMSLKARVAFQVGAGGL